MPDLSKEEVEWRLDRVYGDKVNGDTTAWEREELLQTALSLYARAEEAEQERDTFRAEAMGMREWIEHPRWHETKLPDDWGTFTQPDYPNAPLTAAVERWKAMEAVCEAAKGGCCNGEIDHDCDVRADCAWGAVCATLAALDKAGQP